ncbi:MAG: class II aldolase/adducin family protein [Elusimicrobia bacterium]|nr:class II aldolase/adducin family protein [Elusimicrobiota bacterium]
MKTEIQCRQEMAQAGRRIYDMGLVAGVDGNLSVRLSADRILATPTGMSKGNMKSEDMVVVNARGKKIHGLRSATSELEMHLEIYSLRPDVHAVIHAHPPVATGYAAAGVALNKALVSEAIMALGCVPLAPYGTPGTSELKAAMAGLIPRHDAILMANHGVVVYAQALEQALWKLEAVEHFAKISLVTEILGKEKLLSEEQVQKLLKARQAYFGLSSAPERMPDCPVASDPRPQSRATEHKAAGVRSIVDGLIRELNLKGG